MKKLLYLTIVLFTGYWSAVAQTQTTKTIQLTFNASDFTLETEDGLTCIFSEIHDLMFDSDTLTPALPYIPVYVLIGPSQSYLSHTYQITSSSLIGTTYLPRNELDFIPENPSNLDSISVPFTSNIIYPTQEVKYIGEHLIDGAVILSFKVYPYRYLGQSHKLYINNGIRITITLDETPTRTGSINYPLGNMYDVVQNLVINPEDLPLGNLLRTGCSLNRDEIVRDYEYLIITTESMKNEFQVLADWKNQKGIKTKVLTTSDIDNNSNYNSSTFPMSIKKAIKDYYDGTYHGLKYVLMGGVGWLIPSPKISIKDDNYQDASPTDYYYACLDQMDWDSNGNLLLGENGETITDLAPEVVVSRLAVLNPNDAHAVIEKIINYEKYGIPSAYSSRILMSGVKAKKNYWPTGKSDSHYKGDWLYDRYIADNWNGSLYRFYDTGTSFPGNANYDVTKEHLNEQISEGYPFIYMATHGDSTHWKMETAPDYIGYSGSTINPAYSIIATTACKTNNFHESSCFSASFFLNNANIVGYYGGSRATHGHPRRWHIGSANKIIGHFFKGLFQTNGAHYGDAIMASKIDNINECKSYKSSFRWDFFSFNSLGDPEMPVFTSTPNTFSGVSVIYQNGLCSVSTGGVEGCNICVMSKNDNGASYYSVKKNVQEASFDANVDECSICITKTGYLPYITSASNITYIQNQTLTGNNTINSSETYIGRNVTTQVSQGDVIVQSGSLTINSSNKTVIKNSFKVNTGAALRIEKSN